MDAEDLYGRLKEVAFTRFSDVVSDCFIIRGPLNFPRCLRVIFTDDSFMEVRISEKKYSFHYDRRLIDGDFFRLDNAPHHKKIKTFPDHFHERKEDNVKENTFLGNHKDKFIGLMEFISRLIREN